jgi:light-regulated signal transduction histidine kinase (bacteriophytochrome)
LFSDTPQTETSGLSYQELELKCQQQVEQIQRLKKTNQELEQFTYIASHDLQEPLRKIKNFGEMLTAHSRDSLDDRSLKYMKYILDGTERMQALLENLLLYSRSLRQTPRQKLDLNLAVQQALEDVDLRIQETKAEVTVAPLPVVSANATQMHQLFQNLLSNALKFCGEHPQIQIAASQQEDHWLLSVNDNGIGMPADAAQRIFEPFQRLHLKSEYPGTGIGLAICQKIIDQHQGKIWVESTLGEGSTFFFSLPLFKGEQDCNE